MPASCDRLPGRTTAPATQPPTGVPHPQGVSPFDSGRRHVTTEAIPTTYRGTRMRSRLEADWAATLDHYEIEWEYEPELLELQTGELYLPDFWLPRLGIIIEAKGALIGRQHKPADLAAEVGPDDIVLLGFAPLRRTFAPYQHDYAMKWREVKGYDARFTRCISCSAWQWLRPQLSRNCRMCSQPATGYLARPEEMRFVLAEREYDLSYLQGGQ